MEEPAAEDADDGLKGAFCGAECVGVRTVNGPELGPADAFRSCEGWRIEYGGACEAAVYDA